MRPQWQLGEALGFWRMAGFHHGESVLLGLLWGLSGKEPAYSAGGTGSIPGLGTSPEKGMATHSNVLAWRIPMDRGAWQATVHGVSKSDTTQVT